MLVSGYYFTWCVWKSPKRLRFMSIPWKLSELCGSSIPIRTDCFLVSVLFTPYKIFNVYRSGRGSASKEINIYKGWICIGWSRRDRGTVTWWYSSGAEMELRYCENRIVGQRKRKDFNTQFVGIPSLVSLTTFSNATWLRHETPHQARCFVGFWAQLAFGISTFIGFLSVFKASLSTNCWIQTFFEKTSQVYFFFLLLSLRLIIVHSLPRTYVFHSWKFVVFEITTKTSWEIHIPAILLLSKKTMKTHLQRMQAKVFVRC